EGTELKSSFGAVEGEIYQVRNQSRQDPLNFPIKLNNKLAALMRVVEAGDGRPTEQSYTVFEELSVRLGEQLERMRIIIDNDLAEFNELLRRHDLEPIEVRPVQPMRPITE